MLLDPTVANLNTGSFGPLPRVVFERVTELRRRLAEEPMDFLLRQAPPLLWQARERLAGFLGTDPYRLVFAANVTAAINTIAAGLRLTAPAEILLTDYEYGAMHWCWERTAQRQGMTLRIAKLPLVPKSAGEIVDAIQREMTERTRLLFFSHVLSPNGLVLPAKELCGEARRRGILTVIDGAHAPAMIPLNINELGCDFYAGNCHKWLLAPTGAGFLYFSPGSEDRLGPLQVSWGWHYDRSRADQRDEFGSTPRLRSFEFEGTRDPCAWLTVPAAIDFQARLGWEKIRACIAELTGYVRRRLSGERGMPAATPAEPKLHGAMAAFCLPDGTNAAELRRRLWEVHRIEVPIIERPRGLLIRVSTHFFNTEEEIDRLAEALKQC
jgi:isopenicillin-N epimerase